MRMVVMNCAAKSRTITQQNQSHTHCSMPARTIRRRLQQRGMSARRTLLRLSLTGNHRRLRGQWCVERWTWTMEWNDIVFTDEFRNITTVGFESGDPVGRDCCNVALCIAPLVLHLVLWF
ncbi:transposable element Tcb1 transposase [Trichonephila clavipes]|nr:transposable element Tcb1 transposase [Trichonephila clavipes]